MFIIYLVFCLSLLFWSSVALSMILTREISSGKIKSSYLILQDVGWLELDDTTEYVTFIQYVALSAALTPVKQAGRSETNSENS